ncbi:MAG: hypothetical protein ABUL60_20330 [Myxococcales bacterium]
MSKRRQTSATLRNRDGRILPALLLLLVIAALPACHKKRATSSSQAPPVKVANPAELGRNADAAKESLEGLKPLVAALNKQFEELHHKYDTLPPALPGFADTRGKFYSTAEGLGTMNAKLVWLSGRIESALKAGDGAALAETGRDITHTYDEVRQVERVTAELVQEMPPFLQQAEQAQANGLRSCE